MTPEGTLFIKNAVPKDAGIYGCLASNSAGTDKQTSTLTYIGKYNQFKRQLRQDECHIRQCKITFLKISIRNELHLAL